MQSVQRIQKLCLKKNIPDIIDCNLKKDCRILIIFGTNIPDTTGHQTTVRSSSDLTQHLIILVQVTVDVGGVS